MWCFYLKTTFILQMCLRRGESGVRGVQNGGVVWMNYILHILLRCGMKEGWKLWEYIVHTTRELTLNPSSRMGLWRLNCKIQHWQDTQIIILGYRIIQLGCFFNYKHKPFLFFNYYIKNCKWILCAMAWEAFFLFY